VKYFFDNCISYRYADMLSALGVEVEALRHSFSESITDMDLFEQLRGWEVAYLSGDTSQTTQIHEARALKECGITALFLGPFWSKMTFWPQAIWLVKHWETIDGFARAVSLGTCAELTQRGKAKVFQL
jgi:hypothetical protein